jgi:hypothetical protein
LQGHRVLAAWQVCVPRHLSPRTGSCFLQRGRTAAASTLTDQLGAALLRRAGQASQHSDGRAGDATGKALRDTIQQIRIGAVTDAAGTIRRQAR